LSCRTVSDPILKNIDEIEAINLTNNPTRDYSPVFSPDGSKIAFVTNRDGNEEIYIIDIDGSGQTNLFYIPDGEHGQIFQPIK